MIISPTAAAAPAIELSAWTAGLTELPAPRRRPYRTYRATFARLAELCAALPTARAEVIGASRRGEPIWSVVVEPRAPGPAAATVAIVAGLHAMEHVGTATILALLERAAASERWHRHRLVLVPVANPDGFRHAELLLAAGSRRFARRNANAVDLNRNFAVFWDDNYYLNTVLRTFFASGPTPLSEPETRALDGLMAAQRPRYAVSLHAFGEVIYVPYGGSRESPAQLDRMLATGRAMAARQARPYPVMQLGRRYRWFKARGCEIDHFYERYGALSFLFEIGAGPRARRPGTWLSPYDWFTPPAPLLEADVANVVPALEALADLD
jgi:hypothetical protein